MNECIAPSMSDLEKKVIRLLDYDKALDEAIEIYLKWLPVLGPRGTLEMRYMTEVHKKHQWHTENLGMDYPKDDRYRLVRYRGDMVNLWDSIGTRTPWLG